jgi:hypothetical protein
MQKDTKERTSAISNDVRVVKGGSWQDTAYWLDPGQRRYKNQGKLMVGLVSVLHRMPELMIRVEQEDNIYQNTFKNLPESGRFFIFDS